MNLVIIISSYNNKKYLQTCLQILRKERHREKRFEIKKEAKSQGNCTPYGNVIRK